MVHGSIWPYCDKHTLFSNHMKILKTMQLIKVNHLKKMNFAKKRKILHTRIDQLNELINRSTYINWPIKLTICFPK